MKRIHISLPEKLVEEFDKICEKDFMNRSEVIKALMLTYIRMERVRRDETNK